MPQVEIDKIKCVRCVHERVNRTTDVRRYAKCRSPYRDNPKLRIKTEKQLPALAYVKAHVQQTDMGKLSPQRLFEGSGRIRHDLWQRVATLWELALICNRLNVKPAIVPVATIEYDDPESVDSLIHSTRR